MPRTSQPESGADPSAACRPPTGRWEGSGEMFDGIAHRYDLLNRLLSLGVDQLWRKRAIAALRLRSQARVLDVASGTGDLARRVLTTCPGATVVGLDPSRGMLEVARSKVAAARLAGRAEFVLGNVEQLPFDAESFDGVCVGFGIRNVRDRRQALAEMARVTRPAGRVVILELSDPNGGPWGPLARFYVHTVVPWVGSVLSGSEEYRYLARSIAAFPPAAHFAQQMREAGLEVLQISPQTFGVAHLYVGQPESGE